MRPDKRSGGDPRHIDEARPPPVCDGISFPSWFCSFIFHCCHLFGLFFSSFPLLCFLKYSSIDLSAIHLSGHSSSVCVSSSSLQTSETFVLCLSYINKQNHVCSFFLDFFIKLQQPFTVFFGANRITICCQESLTSASAAHNIVSTGRSGDSRGRWEEVRRVSGAGGPNHVSASEEA